MFTHIPTYDKYRTLELKSPLLKGEDVYALQKALTDRGFVPGTVDGIFGLLTRSAVREAQERFGLVIDGKAGGATQQALALDIANWAAGAKHCRFDCLRGQLEHESGFRLGIYSSPPRDDGSFDAGVTQRNTAHTPPEQGFDPVLSIIALAENTRRHYDLFAGIPERRRWMLAQGSWNAPAFACYIAREEGAIKVTKAMTATPSAASRQTFEDYMTKVSKYLANFL